MTRFASFKRACALSVLAAILLAFLLFPFAAHAQFQFSAARGVADALVRPFGGMITVLLPCLNASGIYLIVGPPLGGDFVWRPGIPYLFNPPSHPGQWILGVSGPSLSCNLGIGDTIRANGIIINGTSL